MSEMHMTNEQLTEIVRAEAAKHGYTDSNARFVKIMELKVRWTRTHDWISMEFSDYLDVLSPTAMKALVAGTFNAITTGNRAEYSAAFRRSIGSKKFFKANRDKYLTRCRLIHHTEYAGVPDVSAAALRLYGKGLIEPLPDLMMAWKDFPTDRVPFQASGAFKTVVFNTSLFQDPEGNVRPIDEDCLDYLVYCGILKAGCMLPTDEDRTRMAELARAYPDRASIIERLFEAGIDGRVFE